MARAAPAVEEAAPTRLAADDWLRAAFEIMVDEGIGGVKVPRLCERLGVTKGSFYWHFADVDAFLGALATRWAEESERTPGPLTVEDPADAESVLVSAMEQFADRRVRNLTRAMREWAQTDERARTALRSADEALFHRIKDAFTSLGFSNLEAEVRGKILYYSGVGFAHVGPLGARPAPMEQLGATWDILARRP
jgi:AcrR family transcriptional regulator